MMKKNKIHNFILMMSIILLVSSCSSEKIDFEKENQNSNNNTNNNVLKGVLIEKIAIVYNDVIVCKPKKNQSKYLTSIQLDIKKYNTSLFCINNECEITITSHNNKFPEYINIYLKDDFGECKLTEMDGSGNKDRWG